MASLYRFHTLHWMDKIKMKTSRSSGMPEVVLDDATFTSQDTLFLSSPIAQQDDTLRLSFIETPQKRLSLHRTFPSGTSLTFDSVLHIPVISSSQDIDVSPSDQVQEFTDYFTHHRQSLSPRLLKIPVLQSKQCERPVTLSRASLVQPSLSSRTSVIRRVALKDVPPLTSESSPAQSQGDSPRSMDDDLKDILNDYYQQGDANGIPSEHAVLDAMSEFFEYKFTDATYRSDGVLSQADSHVNTIKTLTSPVSKPKTDTLADFFKNTGPEDFNLTRPCQPTMTRKKGFFASLFISQQTSKEKTLQTPRPPLFIVTSKKPSSLTRIVDKIKSAFTRNSGDIHHEPFSPSKTTLKRKGSMSSILDKAKAQWNALGHSTSVPVPTVPLSLTHTPLKGSSSTGLTRQPSLKQLFPLSKKQKPTVSDSPHVISPIFHVSLGREKKVTEDEWRAQEELTTFDFYSEIHIPEAKLPVIYGVGP